MMRVLNRQQVYRVCAVCGKRHGSTYGFRNSLARLGIEGDKAVPSCVIKANRKFIKQRQKEGHKS